MARRVLQHVGGNVAFFMCYGDGGMGVVCSGEVKVRGSSIMIVHGRRVRGDTILSSSIADARQPKKMKFRPLTPGESFRIQKQKAGVACSRVEERIGEKRENEQIIQWGKKLSAPTYSCTATSNTTRRHDSWARDDPPRRGDSGPPPG